MCLITLPSVAITVEGVFYTKEDTTGISWLAEGIWAKTPTGNHRLLPNG